MRWAEPGRLQLLWLLPLFLAFLWWRVRARSRLAASLGDPRALAERMGEAGPWTGRLRGVLELGALALLIVGLARPQAGFRLVTTTSRGADVAIVLDISHSMEARDVAPDRLRAAQREIATLIGALSGSSMGLILVAGEGQVVSPLSTDSEGLISMVEDARPGEVDRPGSDLEAGLVLSARLLRRPGDRPRAVVLVGDGESTQGDPRAGAAAVRKAGARLFTIGLGGTAGAAIPIVDTTGAVVGERRGPDGQPVRSRLDEGALRDLARRGGGRYERGDGGGRAGLRVADGIRSGGEQEVRGQTVRAYDDRYPWLAAAAGLLLVAQRVVPRRRRR